MKEYPIVRVQSLRKSFRTNDGGALEAVTEVSFEIPENDFVCIVGPSGCGKSTLLRMIAGLESITAGEIDYRGETISRPRKEIGMVFQEYSLLPWRNVIDNVALGPEFSGVPLTVREEKAMEYLRLVGMEAFSQSFPHELSGGMRQRVAIVRALANDPDVLLMDEPFGALDALTRERLQVELRQIQAEEAKTIIFVTHDVEEAVFLADRIILFSARPARVLHDIDVTAVLLSLIHISEPTRPY